jgi:membrane-bound ClpP family serine protease
MEIIGHIATIFVIASFFLKDLKNLRLLNLIGAVLFIIYGLSISSVPVILTNSLIFIINSTHLLSDTYKEIKDENKKSNW